MTNLDNIKQRKDTLRAELAEAVRAADEKKIGEALDQFMQFMSDTIMAEASGVIDSADRNVLAARGVRQLTAEETKFYEGFIARARGDAQTVITGIGDALPQTIIDSVMDDMKQAYPLLNMIDFTNTGAAIKWVLNAQGAQAATWDELNTAITKDLEGAIAIVDMTQRKLSAYMYTTQDMLDLGPVWVDRYVRAVLADALSAGLEVGIVDGNGLKEPIGMTRNFAGPLDPTTGYARKGAASIVSFGPAEYGGLLARLTVDGNSGKQRAVSRVIFIVNPTDYFTKVFPAVTIKNVLGQYVEGVFPFPTDVVQSVGVPAGHAVMGIAKKYFMGVGTGKGGKLEYSDEYKFLEDLRTYKIKFYGMGRPYDINAFIYLDISGLGPVYPTINTNEPLNGLTVAPEAGGTQIYGVSTSTLQTGVSVNGGTIKGTLKYHEGPDGITSEWGEGNFLVLKFSDVASGATSVKVGLEPSAGSGLVELLGDPDMNGLFKITDPKNQKFKVITSDGTRSTVQTFDLSKLVLQGPSN